MLFKKILMLVLVLTLGACGWRPVYYQKQINVPLSTAQVEVLPVPEEAGRFLTQQLKDLLNPQKIDVEKKYTLQISIKESLNSDQGILGDNTSTRATMRLTAQITLKEKEKVLLNTSTFATSSYNILMLPYPTVTAENKTRERLLDMLADQIAMRVTVYFQKQQDKQ